MQRLMRVCYDYLGLTELTELTGQTTGASANCMDSGITTHRNDIDGAMDTESNNEAGPGFTGTGTAFGGLHSSGNRNSKNYNYTSKNTVKNAVGGKDIDDNQAGFSVIAAIFELIKGGMYSSGNGRGRGRDGGDREAFSR